MMNKIGERSSPTLVSVIIPVYNGEKYLEEAIQSVLNQSHHSLDFILVDDGSEDSSARIAKKYVPPLRYTYQKHQGLSAARNKGIALAQGQFFAWLDADDVWERDKLENQLAAFKNNPELDIVFGHMQQFFSPDLDVEERERIRLNTALMPGYSPCALLVKRDSFFKVGLFELKWELGQDIHWFLRAKEKELQTLMLPDLVFRRRIHSCNAGRMKRQFQHHYVHIIKESLDRRRVDERNSGKTKNKKK
jgi:glycosyltransferase involved in cell wall biosynthesis